MFETGWIVFSFTDNQFEIRTYIHVVIVYDINSKVSILINILLTSELRKVTRKAFSVKLSKKVRLPDWDH